MLLYFMLKSYLITNMYIKAVFKVSDIHFFFLCVCTSVCCVRIYCYVHELEVLT